MVVECGTDILAVACEWRTDWQCLPHLFTSAAYRLPGDFVPYNPDTKRTGEYRVPRHTAARNDMAVESDTSS